MFAATEDRNSLTKTSITLCVHVCVYAHEKTTTEQEKSEIEKSAPAIFMFRNITIYTSAAVLLRKYGVLGKIKIIIASSDLTTFFNIC